MKEKLISFTRSKKNVRWVNIIHWIILIAWMTIVLFFYNATSPVVALILDAIFIINVLSNDIVKILSEENEDVIRNNKIILILLANSDVVGFLILIISMIILLFMNISVTITINVLFFFLAIVLVFAFLFFIFFISLMISKYFRKKLK